MLKKYNITPYLLVALSMLYITFKITCNPLFFRQVTLYIPFTILKFKLNASSFIYPAIYVISDAIVAITGRKMAIAIILMGVLCDGIFSLTINKVSMLNIPSIMSSTELLNTTSINIIGSKMNALFINGCIAAIFAAIVEVVLFSILFRKLNNFFVSTVLSVVITLVIHNLLNDYSMLKNEPDVWEIIINNWIINISIMTLYALFISIGLKLINIYKK